MEGSSSNSSLQEYQAFQCVLFSIAPLVFSITHSILLGYFSSSGPNQKWILCTKITLLAMHV